MKRAAGDLPGGSRLAGAEPPSKKARLGAGPLPTALCDFALVCDAPAGTVSYPAVKAELWRMLSVARQYLDDNPAASTMSMGAADPGAVKALALRTRKSPVAEAMLRRGIAPPASPVRTWVALLSLLDAYDAPVTTSGGVFADEVEALLKWGAKLSLGEARELLVAGLPWAPLVVFMFGVDGRLTLDGPGALSTVAAPPLAIIAVFDAADKLGLLVEAALAAIAKFPKMLDFQGEAGAYVVGDAAARVLVHSYRSPSRPPAIAASDYANFRRTFRAVVLLWSIPGVLSEAQLVFVSALVKLLTVLEAN